MVVARFFRTRFDSVQPSWRLAILVAGLLSGSSPARAAVDIQGIDISHWQGTISKTTWGSIKDAGYDFVFMKATQGNSYNDPEFANNITRSTSKGLLAGPYHFCELDTGYGDPTDPVTEANHFLSIIMPYYQTGSYLPPVADVERFPTGLTTAQLQTLTSTWVQAFSDRIYDALGVRPIVYNSLSKANSYYTSSVAGSHELWLAWWKGTGTTSPPVASDTPKWGIWQFWQWSDGADSIAQANPVPGISGNVDRDVYYGNETQLNNLTVSSLVGDFNRDGKVDGRDYIVWRKSKGQTVQIYSGADANGDGTINTADYTMLREHFGQTSGSGAGAGAALGDGTVPEPVSIWLVGGSFCFLATHRGLLVRRRLTIGDSRKRFACGH
jgi:GH25 family lysozyme M1 (1,4-beta-N-acetylmuramidase)